MDLYEEAVKIITMPRVAIGTLITPPDDLMTLIGEIYFTPCSKYEHEDIFGGFLFLTKYIPVPFITALISEYPKQILEVAISMERLQPNDFAHNDRKILSQNLLMTVLYRMAYLINFENPIDGLDELVLILGRQEIMDSKIIGVEDPTFVISQFAYTKIFDIIFNAIVGNAIKEMADQTIQ